MKKILKLGKILHNLNFWGNKGTSFFVIYNYSDFLIGSREGDGILVRRQYPLNERYKLARR